jgi:urease accessory protein
VKGHLHLVCGPGGDGNPCLTRQSFRAPFHLSKPHVDAGGLVVNVVNPTAGMFDGDELDLDVRLEDGAHLVLTTPSASRVFRSRSGHPAVMRQKFDIGPGCLLEFTPEPLIPHAGSVYEQTTELHVARGASLLFFEWLAPGRVASGEALAFASITWSTDLWQDGMLSVRERYRLTPDDHSLVPLRLLATASHYLGCFIAGDFAFPADEVEALQTSSCYLGWSPLPGGGWTIKALCDDALTTRKLMTNLRRVLHSAMGCASPALRRY